jgi:hypothetical protein
MQEANSESQLKNNGGLGVVPEPARAFQEGARELARRLASSEGSPASYGKLTA